MYSESGELGASWLMFALRHPVNRVRSHYHYKFHRTHRWLDFDPDNYKYDHYSNSGSRHATFVTIDAATNQRKKSTTLEAPEARGGYAIQGNEYLTTVCSHGSSVALRAKEMRFLMIMSPL